MPTCDKCGFEAANAGSLATHRRYNHADDGDAGDDGGDLDPVEGDDDPAGSDPSDPPADDGGGDLDPADDPADDTVDDGGGSDDGLADDADDLDLDDDDDAKDYNCGNCGTPVEYLGGEDAAGGGKKCPECGDRLLWSKV